jgi:hypothetical protein
MNPEAPPTSNEAARLEALREFDFLYEDQGDSLRRLCSLARQFFAASASVTLVNRDRVNFLQRLAPRAQPRIRRRDVLHDTRRDFEVEDLKADRFSRISTWLRRRYPFAGVPSRSIGRASAPSASSDLSPPADGCRAETPALFRRKHRRPDAVSPHDAAADGERIASAAIFDAGQHRRLAVLAGHRTL